MLKLVVVFLCCIGCFSNLVSAQDPALPIVPKPVSEQRLKGNFVWTKETNIIVNQDSLRVYASFLEEHLKTRSAKYQASDKKKQAKRVLLSVDPGIIQHKEGYVLVIDSNSIRITGADQSGLFYGIQTLLQLTDILPNDQLAFPCAKIEDYPRFGYRGMHLDVGRYMFSPSTIKKWLDVLAYYKINTFHWHLTDDQGWRIDIHKYPLLRKKGAFRAETIIGHKRASPHQFDGIRYGGYYTHAEIREIVAYAKSRRITVIPEIEMPGHALAALAAYPNLGCTGGPYQPATYWGVFDDVFCAGSEETFEFLTNVLTEVMELFPSTYIHIGGDECPKTRWKACPKCQQRMKEEQLTNENELQSYFIRRVAKFVESKGRKIIGWDEILEGGISPGATIMSWRGEDGGIAAAKLGHQVIMTPEKFVYLDYYQSLYSGEQIAAGGFTPLEKVYRYEPVPKSLNIEESQHIIGVQANVWSEYLPSKEHAEYMIFPRIIALAESGWSQKENKSFPEFLTRLSAQEKFLQGINYAKTTSDLLLFPSNDGTYLLKSNLPDAEIRYTLDGTAPHLKSPKYTGPINLKETSVLKAVSFSATGIKGRVFQQQIHKNKASGNKIILKNTPAGNYAVEPGILVNGILGTAYYNTGEWLGFRGNDFQAIIDLGSSTTVTEINIGILKYHWQKMWAPKGVKFEVSANGKSYQTVADQTNFAVEGINRIVKRFKPINARFIRITASTIGVIPKGSYGAGEPAWLLVDEIEVK